MHSFEVHSNESACRKSDRLGLEQVLYIYPLLLCLLGGICCKIWWQLSGFPELSRCSGRHLSWFESRSRGRYLCRIHTWGAVLPQICPFSIYLGRSMHSAPFFDIVGTWCIFSLTHIFQKQSAWLYLSGLLFSHFHWKMLLPLCYRCRGPWKTESFSW